MAASHMTKGIPGSQVEWAERWTGAVEGQEHKAMDCLKKGVKNHSKA